MTLEDSKQYRLVREYLNGDKISKLHIEYGCSKSYVLTILKRHGAKIRSRDFERRKHVFRFDYFNKIDTPNKAYALGLLYADGYVNKTYSCLALAEGDKHILEEMAKDIGYKENLRHIIRDAPLQNMYQLYLGSKEMTQDLINLGCVNKKSLILRFPTKDQVPNELVRDFVRGYFDGDGCACVHKKNLLMTFTATKHMCEGIKRHVSSAVGKKVGSIRKHNSGNAFVYYLGGNTITAKVSDWLYPNGCMRLDRKFNKIMDFKNGIKDLK